MAKENSTQSNLSELVTEAKKYYSLQKEHLRYTAAEQSTRFLSTLTILAVAAVLGVVIFIFLGLAFVHLLNNWINSMAACYAIYTAILFIILLIFYFNRRKWVILPFARIMTKAFIKDNSEEEEEDED